MPNPHREPEPWTIRRTRPVHSTRPGARPAPIPPRPIASPIRPPKLRSGSAPSSVPPEMPSGARQGINDGGDIGSSGPSPPPGGPHRYYFRLHALDSTLNLPPGVNRSDLEAAMEGHVLARAVTMGTYERRKR